MKLKQYFSILLTSVLLWQGMAAAVGAQAEETDLDFRWQVNPAYADAYPEDGPEGMSGGEFLFADGSTTPEAEVFYTDLDAAAAAAETAMAARETQFTIGYSAELYSALAAEYGEDALFGPLYRAAERHDTASPTHGDYLWYHVNRYGYDGFSNAKGYSITYTIRYNSTAEQEALVDAKVAELVTGWKNKGLTGLDAIEAIYNYITTTVEYDNAGLAAYNATAAENRTQEHREIYSAYAALIKGTAVCQGYANLFYRLALEMGIDARFISGWGVNANNETESHGWNIVEYNDLYYNIDTTWDAGRLRYGYSYYMASNKDFTDHIRNDQFLTEAFTAAYPMASSTILYTKEANPGGIEFAVPKAATPWTPDGLWYEGEYYEIETDIGWTSVSVNDPANYRAAKSIWPFLAMSWDEEYVYTMLKFTDPNGHNNTWGTAPGNMWYSGCLQVGFAEADATGAQRLEYGIGRTSDTDTLISAVWENTWGSGYTAPTEDFGVSISGDSITYEFRTPISAFSADDDVAVGDTYGVCLNISWGNDTDFAHTQLGSGIAGYAGKAAQNFMHFTLVEKEGDVPVVPEEPDEPDVPEVPDEPEVPAEIVGDLDGNGVLDEADVALISDWFAGKTTALSFDPAKADFNKDNRFSRADGMYLARALAGWDGYTLS